MLILVKLPRLTARKNSVWSTRVNTVYVPSAWTLNKPAFCSQFRLAFTITGDYFPHLHLGTGKRFFSTPTRPVRLWGPRSSLFSGYRGASPGAKRLGVNLTTDFHLVPRLKVSGAIPLLPLSSFTEWDINRLMSVDEMRCVFCEVGT